MATRFKIEQNPTFAARVAIDRAGGDKIDVGFVFKYRTQTEISELLEEWSARRKSAAEEIGEGQESVSALTKARIELEVQEVLEMVESWEFDDKLCEDSVRALLDGCMSAKASITNAYMNGLNPARLGN